MNFLGYFFWGIFLGYFFDEFLENFLGCPGVAFSYTHPGATWGVAEKNLLRPRSPPLVARAQKLRLRRP